MTRRAGFTQADYARAVAGAIKGGWPVGTFKIAVENGELAILPAGPVEPSVANDGGSWVDLAGTTQDHRRA